MTGKRSHVLSAAVSAAYLVASVALIWQGGDDDSADGVIVYLAGVVWLFGSPLAGARFGVPAVWLPIAALPVGILSANTWGHNTNELRVLNWGIVFVASLVLVSAGVWAWVRRPRR